MRHRALIAATLLMLAGCDVCRQAKPVAPVARRRRVVMSVTPTPTSSPMPTPTREPTARERLLQGQPQP